jgi:hypothetical protein
MTLEYTPRKMWMVDATGELIAPVAPPYSRLVDVALSPITMADTYAAQENIGGDVFGIDLSAATGVSMANELVRIGQIEATLWASTVTSSGAIVAVFFNSDPTATTWTDSGVTTINTADKAKVAYIASMSAANGTNNFANMTVYLGTNVNPYGGLIRCDANGKIWLALQSGGVMTLSGAVLNVNVIFGHDG